MGGSSSLARDRLPEPGERYYRHECDVSREDGEPEALRRCAVLEHRDGKKEKGDIGVEDRPETVPKTTTNTMRSTGSTFRRRKTGDRE